MQQMKEYFCSVYCMHIQELSDSSSIVCACVRYNEKLKKSFKKVKRLHGQKEKKIKTQKD